jgi:hypothetical protein
VSSPLASATLSRWIAIGGGLCDGPETPRVFRWLAGSPPGS